MHGRNWATVGLVGLVAALSGAYFRKPAAEARAPQPEREESGDQRDEIAELRAQTERLSRLVQASRADRTREANQEEPDQAELADQIEAEAKPIPLAERPPAEVIALAKTTYEAFLASQPRDPSWAPERERELSGFFQTEGVAGFSLESAQCGSTICQVNLKSDGSGTFETLSEKIGRPPLTGGGFIHTDPDTGNVELFFNKQGSELPPLDEST